MGEKCLIAIYLPNAAFDTHDEPASFDCHLLRRQDSSAHTLLSTELFSVHALCLCFLLRLCILRKAPTQGRLLRQGRFCHCRETSRASHTAMCSKRSRDAESFEEAFLKQKGFPYVLVCLASLSFPPYQAELTDGWLSICTY